MTNNRNSNFQEIYQEELGIVTQDFIGLLEKHFENNDAYVLEDEINAFRAMLVEERYKISNKRIQGELNFDSYTVGLLNIYDELKRKASINKGIDVFTILVTKHLDDLKNATENYNNVIPENIKLPTEDTIRLLAKYDALESFIRIVQFTLTEINSYENEYSRYLLGLKHYISNPEEMFVEVQTEEASVNTSKLKSNLSVPELSLLFKLLHDLKPSIFDVGYNSELYRFINANFRTKGSDNISIKSLQEEFKHPDTEALDFWELKLLDMLAEVRKKLKNS